MSKNYERPLLDEIYHLELRLDYYKESERRQTYEYKLLETKYKNLEKRFNTIKEDTERRTLKKNEKELLEKDRKIEELTNEVARLKAILNNDGTNCGLPTSKTPLNKNKPIPNSRKKSNKNIGGQKGHKKHKLEKFKDEEITEKKYVGLESCPNCTGELIDTNECITKDMLDYKIIVTKTRYYFKKYKCACCGKEVHQKIPKELKEENQYGPEVKSLILSLLNEGNVPINKIKRIIYGLTEEDINLSEGYIAKVQKKAASKLVDFTNELKKEIIKLKNVYWDDTVIFVNQKRACLRFYGDERLSYFVAHNKKDKNGLDEDNILNILDKNTKVMHDHNKVNYNDDYSFTNIECMAHLQRDLQKVTDNLNHEWSKQLKELISKGIERRKKYLEKNITSNEDFSNKFFEKFNDIMLLSMEENEKDNHKYYSKDEKTLILRILDYKDNYFAWVIDFELPTTNNVSERALRGSKTKMKVSGQFQNINRAKDYSMIRSYIETAYRNGINIYDALTRLCLDNPYTVKEILSEKK